MPTGPRPQSVTGPRLKRRPVPCTAAEQMTGWGTWARCALAASSCGVITVLAGCSAGTAATPTPTPTSPASVTSSAAPQGGSTGTIAKPTGSAGATEAVAPLTGLTATAATAQRPAVAVA